MRIEVNYRASDTSLPCVAWAEVRGQAFTGCGKTWEEAEQTLMGNIKKVLNARVPAPKAVFVEIDGADESELLPFFSKWSVDSIANRITEDLTHEQIDELKGMLRCQ